MRNLLAWIDDRTDLRGIVHGALFEPIPGGPRWRYVWGSTLVFTFFVQMVTGIVLWMFYSPGAQSAWESVYYLESHVTGGWLLRGIHHYAAQAMVVLLAIHLAQVVIDGAYKAPREFNFWIGLVLMLIVLGLALTGYLLPWDQKGYWATKVATRIASSAPEAGPKLERLAVGSNDYGHYTLTRFFALHAGLLPALLIALLAVHVALFRKHGITAKISKKRPRPDGFFWPEQVGRDAVACLAILALVLFLAVRYRPELGAPADGADNYAAARPEWYFLFLFQFLKFFEGEIGEIIGAIVIPTLILLFMFLMPLLGRSRGGHVLCVTAIGALLLGAAGLTAMALYADYQAKWRRTFPAVTSVLDEIDIDMRRNMSKSKYYRLSEDAKLAVYFGADSERERKFEMGKAEVRRVRDAIESELHRDGEKSKFNGLDPEAQRKAYFGADANRLRKFETAQADVKAVEDALKGSKNRVELAAYFGADVQKLKPFLSQLAAYRNYQASAEYLHAVAAAKETAERAQVLAGQGIPPAGALSMLRNDPKTQGPRLFKQHCAACHDHTDAKGEGIATLRPLELVTAEDARFEAARPIDSNKPDGPKAAPTGAPNLFGFGSRAWIAGLLDPQHIAAARFDEKTMQVFDAPYFGNTKHWNGEMAGAVKSKFKKMTPEKEARRQKLIAALSAEAGLKSQHAVDAELDVEAMGGLKPEASDTDRQAAIVKFRASAIESFKCTECHKFHGADEGGSAPDLTGYASRQWTIGFISNPEHGRFYGDNNDRMPAFARDAKNPDFNRLSQRDIEMLVDWLRGEWYEPPINPRLNGTAAAGQSTTP
jgi:quinol-cytochrome oxidoreductase complex cytochrome b subunit/mono/diheme cytochrome c family protein